MTNQPTKQTWVSYRSSQLIAWKPKKCVGLSIDVGERVWLDVAKVLQHNVVAERCFVNCMALDILEQTDPPDCKLRPEEGVNAIYELSSGLFAPFTTIFRPLVLNMARKFGYDITSFMAVPYDWRIGRNTNTKIIFLTISFRQHRASLRNATISLPASSKTSNKQSGSTATPASVSATAWAATCLSTLSSFSRRSIPTRGSSGKPFVCF